jgi:pyruvate dehydrogenase E1 component beta subunit
VLGLDVATMGGVFRATDGLLAEFGPQRVMDTPLAEGGIVGASLGLAVAGLRPVAELQFLGFSFQAFHQLAHQVARFRFRSRGIYAAGLTIRAPFGGGMRMPEFHADAVEACFTQIPGLKVVCPSTPADAKGLLLSAIADPDPVLVLEPQRLYRAAREPVPTGSFTVPLGVAANRRRGADVTLVAWSASVPLCLVAAEFLAAEGIDADVLDLRSLVPLDEEALFQSVRSTGRVVVVHEAVRTCGFGAEVAARVHEQCHDALRGPVLRVTSPDSPYPPGSLEDHYLPQVTDVVEAAKRAVRWA